MSVEMTPNDLQTILEDSYKDIIYLEKIYYNINS